MIDIRKKERGTPAQALVLILIEKLVVFFLYAKWTQSVRKAVEFPPHEE